MIHIHNSLTKQKEPLDLPQDRPVHLYSCGPTVYDFAHIGNFRAFLLSDLLTRVLRLNGYEVHRAMNITDVGHLTGDDLADAEGEDKIMKKARVENRDPFEISQAFADFFIQDEATLRILPPGKSYDLDQHEPIDRYRPYATRYVEEQIQMTQDLIDRGFAYAVDGSVYFRTAKFSEYGKLSGNKLSDLQAGARVDINDDKENPLDFALWKHADQNHLMQWTSPWGQGFPGWHIECSAMSQAIFGDRVDIHTGGEDNAFPHHECEIAQNECCSAGLKIPYWLHTKHLMVDGQKMSKSKGNFYTIRDLVDQGWTGPEIRYALICAHYRTALNFTTDSLVQARGSIESLQNFLYYVHKHTGPNQAHAQNSWANAHFEIFRQSLNDDLNVSDALAAVYELRKEFYQRISDQSPLPPTEANQIYHFLKTEFNTVFDVLDFDSEEIPDGVMRLAAARKQARADKDWALADQLRDQIKDLGYEILDGKDGQSLRKL